MKVSALLAVSLGLLVATTCAAPSRSYNLVSPVVGNLIDLNRYFKNAEKYTQRLKDLERDVRSPLRKIYCDSDEDSSEDACIRAVVTRNVYAFTAPDIPAPPTDYSGIPDPEVDYNIIFLKSADPPPPPKPVIVPPNQQKTLVYVISKTPEPLEPEVIEIKENTEDPEVYFISYKPGENPELPGGIDLETALSRSQLAQTSSSEDATKVTSLYGDSLAKRHAKAEEPKVVTKVLPNKRNVSKRRRRVLTRAAADRRKRESLQEGVTDVKEVMPDEFRRELVKLYQKYGLDHFE